MGISKVVYGGNTLIDLTGDTVTADKLLKGITAHGKDGEAVTGTCTYDVDSNDATVVVAEILKGKTSYARGQKLVGTMPNNGAVTGTIKTLAGSYAIAQGYHNGSGKVAISDSEQAKIIASNIKKGVSILGVAGSYEGTASGGGVQVKTGTTSSPTINTGLSKIDKMIIYADKITSVGVVTAVYSADAGKAKVIFCGDYSVYSKPCGITDRSGFSVSGGTFSWTESAKEYGFMNNATYNWIAIGS